ncbi:MAG: DUF134 domain-containing protein [Planctomycetota bacterium]|nr:MAG: DUF134 domain-containing protein [Planctomycetota bacterium]
MSRPKKCRRIGCNPGALVFKPKGVPLKSLDEVILAVDEYEAIRLADSIGMYQENAAENMSISRQTFGRIINEAHAKVADALVNGKALKIEGGDFIMADTRQFCCSDCDHSWNEAYGTGRPDCCPSCKSNDFHRSDDGGRRGRTCKGGRRGSGKGGRRGGGEGGRRGRKGGK